MELTLSTIFILALLFASGVFLGVLLGRRSSGANAAVDRIRQKWEEERAELLAKIQSMKDKGQG